MRKNQKTVLKREKKKTQIKTGIQHSLRSNHAYLENKYSFSRRLKTARDSISFIESGRLFHDLMAEYAKDEGAWARDRGKR